MSILSQKTLKSKHLIQENKKFYQKIDDLRYCVLKKVTFYVKISKRKQGK